MANLDKFEWILGLAVAGLLFVVFAIAETKFPRSAFTHVSLALSGFLVPLTIYISRLIRQRRR